MRIFETKYTKVLICERKTNMDSQFAHPTLIVFN